MFGSHLSVAGGLANALREAETLGLDTVQVFTKNQRQWKPPAVDEEAERAWLAELGRLGWQDRTVSHASYLINLASPDPELWEKSVALMLDEFARCARLSIPFLVQHPGAHMGAGAEAGMDRIAEAGARLLAETAGDRTVLCLETTVGAGTQIGGRFEELAELARRIEARAGRTARERVGFCLDTCHVFAAGYDGRTAEGAAGVLAEFDKVCGLGRLRVAHVNDSKAGLGSRRDLHEHIGEGAVGMAFFEAVVNHPALRGVPKVMETPKGETEKGTAFDTLNLRKLKKLVRKDDGSGAPGVRARPSRRSVRTR
jgi:deoxyribonuclease-4